MIELAKPHTALEKKYQQAILHIEKSELELAASLALELRTEESNYSSWLRRLIDLRIQLKSGISINDDWVTLPSESFLRGEYFFVCGLSAFHFKNWKAGSEYFQKAFQVFSEAQVDLKACLSLYNCFIGKINHSEIAPVDQVTELEAIKKEASKRKVDRVVALADRQLGYIYVSMERFHAAYRYILSACKNLSSCPKSDRDLIILIRAYIEHKLKLDLESQASLEELVEPFDPRVQYSMAVVRYLIDNEHRTPPADNEYEVIDPFFQELLSKKAKSSSPQRRFIWNKKTGVLSDTDQHNYVKVKPYKLEAQLIQLLMSEPRSKATLISCLYPVAGSRLLTENKLHRLVSRVNHRSPGLIVFQDKLYRLKKL